jgi:acyl carrier protein
MARQCPSGLTHKSRGVSLTQSPEDITRIVRECILAVDPGLAAISFDDETKFTTIGVPSIVMITIVFEIEERFDISIIDAGLDDFETVGELRDVVLTLLARKETT